MTLPNESPCPSSLYPPLGEFRMPATGQHHMHLPLLAEFDP
jgi:hypothetical protein